MMRSLFSGVAGLKTHQTKMDVIGNNISNVNTVAFKSSSTTFSDIMYQTTAQASGATATRGGVNAKQIGLGVTNGATKISVTSSGAAQSTGDALDIRLSDTNTTNFFVVNNGSENVFTRAGSFYIDGNGNLAMTTTGYLVMGWQVDPDNPSVITKNTVTPLRVMQASNLTSPPEATTDASFSGVLDKYDSQFKSTGGYIRSFTLYDNLGYPYTAKFSLKLEDEIMGKYSISLTGIYDKNNVDILASYLNAEVPAGEEPNTLDKIFGGDTTEKFEKTYQLSEGFAATSTTSPQTYSYGGISDYTYDEKSKSFVSATPGAMPVSLAQACGLDDSSAVIGVEFSPADTATDPNSKDSLKITFASSLLQFDTKEGNLIYAGAPGSTKVTLHTSLLGPNRSTKDPEEPPEINQALSDITIDFAQLMNYDNGGTSTAVANRGVPEGTIMKGEGKKLGTMTGLSVSNDGRIYGSYSNGNTVLLGQIAAAQFANASGLEEIGNNCYKTTLNSGEFDGIGVDISADGSSMNTGQLEMANVDLSAEFTDMITTQRGFQANSRIITVSDTMLEELINLKR
ncbi:flagellar hook protein FlgE [Pseudobutyrivibrio sp. OR37]|uniref:flagellar hook protein FlgE n=1 Tax=Pseudobutyrivibrio sp. OR37 TaxID=1798186 RepID=UPI0008E22D33|nr:flagellar hook-basal body complex protein [Pseudobutyrivibrio sp. OR37]SFH63046.1 flagellar hook protein FlgE [Pseudobutyrivibrio sp. OR37]